MKRTALRRRTRLSSGTTPRKRRKTRQGQIPEAVLDAAWAKRIRERDGTCQFKMVWGLTAKCHGEIQAAHIYSRTYRQIRWDLENGTGICAGHHFHLHRNPVRAGRFYERLRGRERLDWLWAKAQTKATIDRRAVLESLRSG